MAITLTMPDTKNFECFDSTTGTRGPDVQMFTEACQWARNRWGNKILIVECERVDDLFHIYSGGARVGQFKYVG